MNFSLGERVSILKEAGQYTIIELSSTHALIRDEHGFDQEISTNQLVKTTNVSSERIVVKDETLGREKSSGKEGSDVPRIDLHMEALLDQDSKMSSFDKLNFQLRRFREFVNANTAKRKNRLLVIHGVGEGRLKNEIGMLIAKSDGYSMHDANYTRGGVGASYIEIVLSKAEPI